jgi:hypothetical protein
VSGLLADVLGVALGRDVEEARRSAAVHHLI